LRRRVICRSRPQDIVPRSSSVRLSRLLLVSVYFSYAPDDALGGGGSSSHPHQPHQCLHSECYGQTTMCPSKCPSTCADMLLVEAFDTFHPKPRSMLILKLTTRPLQDILAVPVEPEPPRLLRFHSRYSGRNKIPHPRNAVPHGLCRQTPYGECEPRCCRGLGMAFRTGEVAIPTPCAPGEGRPCCPSSRVGRPARK